MKNNWVWESDKAKKKIQLPKSFISSSLLLFYILAFIVSPYWLAPQSRTEIFMVLATSMVIGVIWSYFSADYIELNINIKDVFLFLLSIVGVFLINYQSLRYDIPWKGDESFHINQVLRIIDFVPTSWFFIFLIVSIIFLYFSWKRPVLGGVLGGLIVLWIVNSYIRTGLFSGIPNIILRYPFVNYWFFSLLPLLVDSKYPYHEALFRIIPVISAGIITWFAVKRLNLQIFTALFWVIALATTPVIFYYSSILYLELPAAFLMMIVALNIKDLMSGNLGELRNNLSWYALILIGFIKETVLSFLFCFLLSRFLFFLFSALVQKKKKKLAEIGFEYILKELPITLLVASPLLLYLALRTIFVDTRDFSPNLHGLLNMSVYPTLFRAFWEQFGLMFLFFLAGCVVLFLEKEYKIMLFYVFTLFFISLFHVVDSFFYTGYSRFNLFILPVLFSGAFVFIKKIVFNKNILSVTIACLLITFNIWASPIYRDGSKKALWGNYFIDTSEHYYPYQESLNWLAKNHWDDYILFVNNNFSYSYEFYFNQIKWSPNCDFFEGITVEEGFEERTIVSVANVAKERNFDVFVYQVVEAGTLLPEETEGYKLEKVFSNDAHNSLVVYLRVEE